MNYLHPLGLEMSEKLSVNCVKNTSVLSVMAHRGPEINGYIRDFEIQYNCIIPSTITDLINAYYDPWIKLQDPPTLAVRHPPMVYYYSNTQNKEYIISSPGNTDSTQCFTYDFTNDSWIILTEYPQGVNAMCHTSTLDQSTGSLYISHGFRYPFAIFDINKQKWNVISENQSTASLINLAYTYDVVSCVVTKHDHELHFLIQKDLNNHHVRYDKDTGIFVSASQTSIDNNCRMTCVSLVYVPGKDMLLSLGGYVGSDNTDQIWYAVRPQEKDRYEWKAFEVKLPIPSSDLCCVALFDFVLMVHYRKASEGQLYFMDLGADKYEWITTKWLQKGTYKSAKSIIVDRANYAHFIHDNKEKRVHSKIHLSRLIPSKLYTKYST
eukprot:11849_1